MSDSALQEIQTLLATSDPPDLGPGRRPGVQAEPALNAALDRIFDRGEIGAAAQPLVRALVLLWHDHLDAAHVIAQSIANPDGAFVHGIMHRREPDYGNAKYWFHRVGKHPAFPEIAKQTKGLMEAKSDSGLVERLNPRGTWDPFAFVDACEEAAGRVGSESSRKTLREIQKIETFVLLSYLS